MDEEEKGPEKKGAASKKKGGNSTPSLPFDGGRERGRRGVVFHERFTCSDPSIFPPFPFFWMDLSRSRLLPAGSFLPPFKQTSCLSALTLARPDRPSSLFSPELVMHAGQRGSGVLVVVGRRIDRF